MKLQLRRKTQNDPQPAPETAPPPDGQCRQIRYNGQRCKLPARIDGYCGVFGHIPPAE